MSVCVNGVRNTPQHLLRQLTGTKQMGGNKSSGETCSLPNKHLKLLHLRAPLHIFILTYCVQFSCVQLNKSDV